MLRYHDITHDDMKNGDGLRTVLWVAGCNHHCKGCQNPVTWNPNDGLPFQAEALMEIFKWCDRQHCAGLTLSGGDPMYPDNREEVTSICKMFRMRYGSDKTIWMYTGYLFEEIMNEPIMEYLDVIVDGKYVEALKDIHYMWAGSTNQRIWIKKDSFWHLQQPEFAEVLNGECAEKEKVFEATTSGDSQ